MDCACKMTKCNEQAKVLQRDRTSASTPTDGWACLGALVGLFPGSQKSNCLLNTLKGLQTL